MALAFAPHCQAGILDQIRTEGVIHCGGRPAPGLAAPAADGTWQGLYPDVCQAIAVAVGGQAQVDFHPYWRDADGAAPGDQVKFLSAGELIAASLLPALLPGPVVFYRTVGLIVQEGSPVRRAAELGEGGVCFEPGTVADRALGGYFEQRGLALHAMPFQEPEELVDAFAAHRCEAVAGEVSVPNAGRYRILPDIIAATPVLAASPVDDGRWAAVIGWTVATLLRAEANGVPPPAGRGMALLPIEAPELGLTVGWQARVVAAVGDYRQIWGRHFGDLPRGPNALQRDGGFFVPPSSE